MLCSFLSPSQYAAATVAVCSSQCHQWLCENQTQITRLMEDRCITSSFHFMNAVVAIDFSHLTASSSASWSSCSPPSNIVNEHALTPLTIWLIVCCWPQSHVGDLIRPHLCKTARHGPWPVWKWFSRDHNWRGRSKPGCQIVGSVTVV